MAKKRKELVKIIQDLHNIVSPMLERAKVSPTRMLRPIDKMEKKDYNDVRKLRTWLQRIHDGPYLKCKKIRDELPEETWKRYEEFGIYDMAEQINLRRAFEKLDEEWGHKPKIRKKGAKRRISTQAN